MITVKIACVLRSVALFLLSCALRDALRDTGLPEGRDL